MAKIVIDFKMAQNGCDITANGKFTFNQCTVQEPLKNL